MTVHDRPEWQEGDKVVDLHGVSDQSVDLVARVLAETFRKFDPDDARDRHKAQRLADPDVARGYAKAVIDTLPDD